MDEVYPPHELDRQNKSTPRDSKINDEKCQKDITQLFDYYHEFLKITPSTGYIVYLNKYRESVYINQLTKQRSLLKDHTCQEF